MEKRKYIIITGGVLSGIGKGTAAASIGKLLVPQYKVIPIKCDGYLNTDPGTMNPVEHGEVYVLDDGGEVDMDFGHYERFLGIDCKKEWNLTSGKMFKQVIDHEREGKYLGKTVQIIPHLTDLIKENIFSIGTKENADIIIIEIGGTVGDIENSWFIEAARQLKKDVGHENILYAHLTFIPFLRTVGEQKTKPAQEDIKKLQQHGIFPDIIIGRSEELLTDKSKEKIALYSDLEKKAIIGAKDISTVYEIPLVFEKEGLIGLLSSKLGIEVKNDISNWKGLVEKVKMPKKEVTIAICGKYTELHDSYASVIEALTHSGAHLDTKVNLKWIETTEIEDGKIRVEESLKGIKGVIIPGGFGKRGAEGKIDVIRYARENNIPFLGLCYGMQLAVIEYARNACNLENANSTEINKKTPHPVVCLLPEQKQVKTKGGTMRLGGKDVYIEEGTLANKILGKSIRRRFRHRFEVNPDYVKKLEEKGLVFSGKTPEKDIMQLIELPNHKFFMAGQFHPELTSKLETPDGMFLEFLKKALE